MLHWNSWWVEPAGKASSATGLPPALPFDAAGWSPEGWIAWQQKWWDQSLQASVAWFRLYGDLLSTAVPVMPWGNADVGVDTNAPTMLLADDAPRATSRETPQAKAMASPRTRRASARVQARPRG